jgi:hypothetical protein
LSKEMKKIEFQLENPKERFCCKIHNLFQIKVNR